MGDHIERYLQNLKEKGKVRIKSSRGASQINIGKRTGEVIDIGGVADITGLFHSFDSESGESSSVKKTVPLNSTSISTKTGRQLPPPPTYDSDSDEEENDGIEVSQPTKSNKLDSDYYSYSVAVDSSRAKLPDQMLSRTYVDQGTQCMTPDSESDQEQKDVSRKEIATQVEQKNGSLSDRRVAAAKTSQSDSRDESDITGIPDSRGKNKSVSCSKKSARKSRSRERNSETDFPGSPREELAATPGLKPDSLREHRQMISSEKSRSTARDGTRTGSLTKKMSLTPKQSHQNLLRRKLSFKVSLQEEGSPRAATFVPQKEVSAIHPVYELDDNSSDGHAELIIDETESDAQEKVGLIFVPTPKVKSSSLLRRRQSSAKEDKKTEKKSSKKSEELKTGRLEKSKTESRGRRKCKQKLFSDSKITRDSSSAASTGKRSIGRPRPQSKRTLDFSASRRETSTSVERLSSRRNRKMGKRLSKTLVDYSSSDEDDEDWAPRSERKLSIRSPLKEVYNHFTPRHRTSGRERHSHYESLSENNIAVSDDEETSSRERHLTTRSSLKAVYNHLTPRCRMSGRERHSHHESLAENNIAVSDDKEKSSRERPLFNKSLAGNDIDLVDDRKSERKAKERVSEEPNEEEKVRNSTTKNEEKQKSKTEKISRKKSKSKVQAVRSGNEADNTDTQSDIPSKKRRSTSFRIHEQSSEGEQKAVSNQGTASRRNRRQIYSSSNGESEHEQPTMIEIEKSPNRSKRHFPKKQRNASQGKNSSKIGDTGTVEDERDLSNRGTASRRNTRQQHSSSDDESEPEQPTLIEIDKSPNRSKHHSPKKQRKTSRVKKTNKIGDMGSEGEEIDVSNRGTASRGNRRQLYSSCVNESEPEQPTLIEIDKSPNRSKHHSPKKQRKTSRVKKTNKIGDMGSVGEEIDMSNRGTASRGNRRQLYSSSGSEAESTVSSLSKSRRKRKLDSGKKTVTKSQSKVDKKGVVRPNPDLQQWLDSRQDKSSFVQLPTPKQQSPDVTKSAFVKRRSIKIIVDESPTPFVDQQSQVEHSPLPTVDESTIITSVDPNRVIDPSSKYVGPPASTPRAARKFQPTRKELAAPDHNEPVFNAAPASPVEDPPNISAESIHSDSADSRDDVSRNSYTLSEPRSKKKGTGKKTAPKSIHSDSADSHDDVSRNSYTLSEPRSKKKGTGKKTAPTAETSKSSKTDTKRGGKSNSSASIAQSQTITPGTRKRLIGDSFPLAAETSKSSKKETKRDGKSKKRPTKKSKSNSRQDEEQSTLVASDNEHTLVEESPKKKKKNNITVSKNNKRAGAERHQSMHLFLHEQVLDIVVPEDTTPGVRRSKRVRTSRPLGYGEKFIYSNAEKGGARTILGIQRNNEMIPFNTEHVQGGTVHIEPIVSSDQRKRNMIKKKSKKNTRKKEGKKKDDENNVTKIVTSEACSETELKRTEENADNNATEQEKTTWSDDMDTASTAGHDGESSSVSGQSRSVPNKTVQLVDFTTGSFVVTDVSTIHVNESEVDGEYVGTVYNEDGVIVTKGISRQVGVSGKLIIEPRKEKKERIVNNGDMFFSLMKGTAKVMIGGTSITLKEGDYITVPCKNPYRIYNPSSRTKAVLVYTMVRIT